MGSKFNHSIYLSFPIFAFVFFGDQYVSKPITITNPIEKTLEAKELENEHRWCFLTTFGLST